MKDCDLCGALILTDNGACKRCADAVKLAAEALPPRTRPSRAPKIVKWLLISLLVAALVVVAGISWVLHALGPMPSFG